MAHVKASHDTEDAQRTVIIVEDPGHVRALNAPTQNTVRGTFAHPKNFPEICVS